MVGMPLLNLGYGLSGLTQGYNQAQQQAMQRAAQQLALQQAQSQQNAQRLASQYLQSPGFKGFGGGFNPANIQPIGGQQAPIPGVTTPSQAPAPPIAQQPPSASPPDNGSAPSKFGGPYYPGSAYPTAPSQDDVPDSSLKDPQSIPLDEPGPSESMGVPGQAPLTGRTTPLVEGGRTYPPGVMSPSELSRWHESKETPATSASPVTTTPDTKPAPGPSDAAPSSATPSTAPATTSDASSGTDSGEGYAIKIPGGPSIPMSQFFGSVDYGQIAQGIAKIAPQGTDQADIYQAVVDLSKLAEGNKTQQQQAGLILRELIKQPFDLEKINLRGQQQSQLEGQRQQGRTALEGQRQQGRQQLEAQREQFRAESQQRSQDFRTLMQKRSFDHADLVRVQNHAQKIEDEAAKRGFDAPKRQAQLIRQEINSYVNRYVDLTSSKTPPEVKARVEALIKQLDQLNTQLFNAPAPAATP